MSKINTSLKIVRQLKNWPTYFADYLKLIKSDKITFSFQNGINLELRPATLDRFAITEVWLYEIYTPKGFEINPNDVVVDIGGHIGSFSVYAAKKAEKGKVLSFEPVPENFELLKRNINLNNLKNVRASTKAISNKSGKKTIYLSSENTCGHSSFQTLISDKKREIIVDAISLEDVFKENNIDKIDLLKIDCEGGEYDILLHAPKDLFKKIKKISMEYHEFDESHNLQILKTFLESVGFNLTIVPSKNIGMIYAKRIS